MRSLEESKPDVVACKKKCGVIHRQKHARMSIISDMVYLSRVDLPKHVDNNRSAPARVNYCRETLWSWKEAIKKNIITANVYSANGTDGTISHLVDVCVRKRLKQRFGQTPSIPENRFGCKENTLVNYFWRKCTHLLLQFVWWQIRVAGKSCMSPSTTTSGLVPQWETGSSSSTKIMILGLMKTETDVRHYKDYNCRI